MSSTRLRSLFPSLKRPSSSNSFPAKHCFISSTLDFSLTHIFSSSLHLSAVHLFHSVLPPFHLPSSRPLPFQLPPLFHFFISSILLLLFVPHHLLGFCFQCVSFFFPSCSLFSSLHSQPYSSLYFDVSPFFSSAASILLPPSSFSLDFLTHIVFVFLISRRHGSLHFGWHCSFCFLSLSSFTFFVAPTSFILSHIPFSSLSFL